jgi:hypothetical protein
MSASKPKKRNYIGPGMCFGVALGCVIGIAFGNLALGIGPGIAIGMAIGAVMSKQRS